MKETTEMIHFSRKVLMRSFFIFFLWGFVSCAPSSKKLETNFENLKPAIVGGVNASIEQAPFVASLHSRLNRGHFCGAVLIADRWALTAAHCLEFQNLRTLRLYTLFQDQRVISQAQEREIVALHRHPQFNENAAFDLDVALLELAAPDEETRLPSIYPEIFQNEERFNSFLEKNYRSTVYGWGATEDAPRPPLLQKAQLPLQANENCRASHPDFEVTENMFCAGFPEGGTDACDRDSGGPLILWNSKNKGTPQLLGLVSWGEACAQENKLGVYTRLTRVYDWIQHVMLSN